MESRFGLEWLQECPVNAARKSIARPLKNTFYNNNFK